MTPHSTPTTLTIRAPADYKLARDVCSYGYFLLRPNRWDVDRQCLETVLTLDHGPATARVSQPDAAARIRASASTPGASSATVRLLARFDRPLSRAEQATARARIGRMLRLDEDEAHTRAFHRIDPRWQASGRCRMFRSATLFEDVIKTVSSCNVAWPNTVGMNRRLCEVLGKKSPAGAHAFPTPERMARVRPGTLRGRCKVGYRDVRMIELAKMFIRGEIDEPWLASPETPDADVFRVLTGLPGIGPYAAGNIMMLLGRYSRLAVDTESVRHATTVLGMTGTERELMKQVAAHYEVFADFRFKSYWFELWAFYETKAGPSHTWKREETATAFTASKF